LPILDKPQDGQTERRRPDLALPFRGFPFEPVRSLFGGGTKDAQRAVESLVHLAVKVSAAEQVQGRERPSSTIPSIASTKTERRVVSVKRLPEFFAEVISLVAERVNQSMPVGLEFFRNSITCTSSVFEKRS
jgi:hypothetical protein